MFALCYTVRMDKHTPKLHEEVDFIADWLVRWDHQLAARTLSLPRVTRNSKPMPHFLCHQARGKYAGLALLIKRRDAPPSAITKEEEKWAKRLAGDGWYVEAVRGAKEAMRAFEDYAALGAVEVAKGEFRTWLTHPGSPRSPRST